MLLLIIITVLFLFIALAQNYFLKLPINVETIQWEQLTPPSSRNYYLLTPQENSNLGEHTQTIQASPVYHHSADTVLKTWQSIVNQQPRVELAHIDQERKQFTYIARSWLFRFPDLITVEFIPTPNNLTTLAIFSRALIGYSDFGVNKKRVTRWLEQLNSKLEQRKASHERPH